jgi:dTDP-4-dehydrorhamnose reductase
MQSSRIWQKPLIVGASGQVGTELSRELGRLGCPEVLRTTRVAREGWVQLDLTTLRDATAAGALLDDLAPDLILCTGAMTFVDGCEVRPEEAYRANAHGPSALASYARSRRIPFVYFSSDYVFDGSAANPGPYAESDLAQPLSVYGASKLQGERAVLRVHPGALVLRTSWVYGADAAGKNFISTVVRQLRAGERVRVPVDQVSTPTLNRDLAQAALQLAAAGAQGVVHVTGPDLISRLDLARAIAEVFALRQELLEGVETSALGQQARRPLRSGLHSERLAQLLPDFRFHTLKEGLAATAGLTNS